MTDASKGSKSSHTVKSHRNNWGVRLIGYVKSKFQKRKSNRQQETATDKAARKTATATIWMAFFTLVLAGMSYATLKEIQGGGLDTSVIASAAKKQAHSADHIAAAAQGFSISADSINKEIGDAVAKLSAQAKATEDARQSSVASSNKSLQATIDNFHQEQRAWLGVCAFEITQLEVDKAVIGAIKFCNSGKTPALKVIQRAGHKLSPIPVDGPTEADLKALIRYPSNAVPPLGSYQINLGADKGVVFTGGNLADQDTLVKAVPSIIDGSLILYIFGDILYEDSFGNTIHDTQFCLYLADRSKKLLGYCKNHNELD